MAGFAQRGITADFDTQYPEIGYALSSAGITAARLTGPGCSGKTTALKNIGLRASLVTTVTFLGCTRNSPYGPGIEYMALRDFTGAVSTAAGKGKCTKQANGATMIASHLYVVDNCEIAGDDLRAFEEQLRKLTSSNTAFGGCWVLLAADMRHPVTEFQEDIAVEQVSSKHGVATIAMPETIFPQYRAMYISKICDEATRDYVSSLPACPQTLRDVIVRIYTGMPSMKGGEELLALSSPLDTSLCFPVRRTMSGGRDVRKALEKRSEVVVQSTFNVILRIDRGCMTTNSVLVTPLGASSGGMVRLPAWYPCRFVGVHTTKVDGVDVSLPVIEPHAQPGFAKRYVVPYLATVRQVADGTFTEETIPLRDSTAITATEAAGVHFPPDCPVLVHEKHMDTKMNALLQFTLHRGGKHFRAWPPR